MNRIDRSIAEANDAVDRVTTKATLAPWVIEESTHPTIRDTEGRMLATVYWPNYEKHPVTQDEAQANARLIAAAPDHLKLLQRLVAHVYCPSCGCDLWNTKGCPICPLMRDANEALAAQGVTESRAPYPEYAEPDEVNVRNMAGVR